MLGGADEGFLGTDILDLCALEKKINKDRDMRDWEKSQAYDRILALLELLSESVKSKPRNCDRVVRPIIESIVGAIGKVRKIMDEVEPMKGPMRFGNRAFRIFLTRVFDERTDILADVSSHGDVLDYFVQSWGSWTRIDFGTGHEMNFLAFIAALGVLELLVPEDSLAIVFDVLWAYWELVLDIQERYNQEAAGSHGAWGVDDYVALPFVFGASQLIDHSEITPANVIDPLVAKAHKDQFVYCKWIDYIYRVKVGEFSENSRTLYSLRGLPHFVKISGGMIKMYKGEILDRFLVVQHFRCGELLKWEQDEPATGE